ELMRCCSLCVFFFQAEDGIRDRNVTGVQTCALPILRPVKVCHGLSNSTLMEKAVYRRLLRLSADHSGDVMTCVGRSLMVSHEIQIGRASCRERVEVPEREGLRCAKRQRRTRSESAEE